MKKNILFEKEIKKHNDKVHFKWNDWGQVTFSVHTKLDFERVHYCLHENGTFAIHVHTLEFKPLYVLLSSIANESLSFKEGKDVRCVDGIKRDYWYGYITIFGIFTIDQSLEELIQKYQEVQNLISECINEFLSNFKTNNKRIWLKWRGDEYVNKEYITSRWSVEGLPTCDYQSENDFIQALKHKNTNNSTIRAAKSYWNLNETSKVGDIIIGFNQKGGNEDKHIVIYGWGYISSRPIYVDNSEKSNANILVHWEKIYDTPIDYYGIKDGYFINQASIDNIIELTSLLNIPDEIPNNMNTQTRKYQEYTNLIKENYNLILTGAPGTGKTYMAKAIAEEMGAVTEFVQFHPSYDYTDFVEGLRPIEKGEDQVGFRRMDGIFKKFCKKAILDDATEDDDILKKLNNDPKVWKVSLEKTYDNPTRTDCLENGYIRIGWSEYGDVEDFNDMQDFPDGGRVILRAFQSEMQIGDIVVSCYSQSETDAIGIVTGDYEFRAEGGNLPRYRTVEWLIKDVKINIQEAIGKKMTLSTVYKLNVSVPKILEIVKNNGGLKGELVQKEKPYVMIIDEINRGELSKIFGELFYAIDPGYRGTKGKVKTQYQNLIDESDVFAGGFYIPENVYILATMNDIDRSVESMDFAMRRRFTWKEVTPNDTVDNIFDGNLDSALASSAKATMTRLNDKIAETDGLGEAFMIGPSYFLKLKKYNGDFEKLWKMNIEPLLKEYLRGFRKANDTLEGFKKTYFNNVNKEEQTSEGNEDNVTYEDEN